MDLANNFIFDDRKSQAQFKVQNTLQTDQIPDIELLGYEALKYFKDEH